MDKQVTRCAGGTRPPAETLIAVSLAVTFLINFLVRLSVSADACGFLSKCIIDWCCIEHVLICMNTYACICMLSWTTSILFCFEACCELKICTCHSEVLYDLKSPSCLFKERARVCS